MFFDAIGTGASARKQNPFCKPHARRIVFCAVAAPLALLSISNAAYAQANDAVTVTALRTPVDKPYRRMIAGVELFEKRRELAPGASLRFKLLPRKRDTHMDDVELAIVGDSFATPVAFAADHTFALERNPIALKENASVRPDRKAGTLTWRAEIRTPGLPPNTRRLGDLRLECEVGMQAGLISNYRPFLFSWMDKLLREGPDYCQRNAPRYLFFADRPLFSVALVAGERREVLSVDRLYGGASRDPQWKDDLPYCDCEVLMDRAYFLPLGDPSWPDDTLVELEYIDEGSAEAVGESTSADVRAALGEALVIDFDSGYEVWVYRELVLLFAPSGVLTKARPSILSSSNARKTP
jgi:hypothetical protein